MNFYGTALELAGAVVLLIWSVRMVRTGVERAHQRALKQFLDRSPSNAIQSAITGVAAAVLLQSSTAVALLTAGFAGSGLVSVPSGLAIMLGADLGSALVVQLLSLDMHWLSSALLLLGGIAFFRGRTKSVRQTGRIMLGIGLVLVSLKLVGTATTPLREATWLPSIAAYLNADYGTAFLLGAAFTWLVHSSVASILMTAAFVSQGLLPLEAGISIILGCNLGSGLIAIGLTRNGSPEGLRVVVGNFCFRAMAAIAFLLALRAFPIGHLLPGSGPAAQLIAVHLAFNVVVLIAGLPFATGMAKLLSNLGASRPSLVTDTALDSEVLDQPDLALASVKRELLHMAEQIERMLRPIMALFRTGDEVTVQAIKQMEQEVNADQARIKLYLSRIKFGDDVAAADRAKELASFAINLEHAGDAIAKTLLKLAEARREKGVEFSAEGWEELSSFHKRVLTNVHLAFHVLMTEDPDAARRLLEEKSATNATQRASAEGHLNRLRNRNEQSIATSNLHLETVQALKTVNSLFASVAYPLSRGNPD